MSPLDGRAAIVTGAAGGIGSGIAVALAAAGAAVVVNHLDTPDAADTVTKEITAAGGRAVAVQGDVARRADWERLVQASHDAFGSWDICVNNAALAHIEPLHEVSEEVVDASFAINLKGPWHSAVLARTRMAEGGRMINISSATTALMFPGYGIYDATKGALEQMTRVLSQEIAERGITANCVSPGATETPTYRIGKTDEFLRGVESLSAFGRLGRVEEIAAVVTFLASPAAGWVTGQNIRVNGGTA